MLSLARTTYAGTRGKDMLSWLQTQANRGVLFVGFCELNGWQDLESLTELPKNRAKIVYRAANAGFAHSHVMVNSQVRCRCNSSACFAGLVRRVT
jgi:hypothetical protein